MVKISIEVWSNEELERYFLDCKDKLTLIDVREEEEFNMGHIPGSIWIPLNKLDDYVSFWPRDLLVVIICNTVNRSAAACRYLAGKGFTNLAYIVPGIKFWESKLTKSCYSPLKCGSNVKTKIYLDYAATTPVNPEVASAVWWCMVKGFGNPASAHLPGRIIKDIIRKARTQVANILKAKPDEIIFTSGGTESDNSALLGILKGLSPERNRLITSSIEHSAILRNIDAIEVEGFSVTVLPVDQTGLVSIDDLKQELDNDVGLVSIMFANNEIGTIQPIKELASISHEYGAYFHTDAVQGMGLCDLNVKELKVDALSLSGHKVYAPKGIGALYLKGGTPFIPLLLGGGQEKGKRGGTENVPGIVGLGVACKIASRRIEKVNELLELRLLLENGLQKINGVRILGHPDKKLPNICNVLVESYKGHDLVLDLDMAGIACSSGSACHGKSPSHVLQAIGLTKEQAKQGIRFSLGWDTTEQQIYKVIKTMSFLLEK